MVAFGECDDTEHCQLVLAKPIDEAANCVEDEVQIVGCGIIGCAAVETVGEDPSGDTWAFADSCQPAGWNEVSSTAPDPCD
jgi:hypothetical protein